MIAAICWDATSGLLPSFQSISKRLLDFKYRNFTPLNAPSDKIVFIDIDEAALGTISKSRGAWPWNRSVWFDTVKLLSEGQPKAVLFDVLLSENDKSSADSDRALATLIHDSPFVSFPISFSIEPNVAQPSRIPASANRFFTPIENNISETNAFNSFSRPYSPLWENVSHIHSVNSKRDTDDIHRSTPLFSNYAGQTFPSLTMKALELYFNQTHWEIKNRTLRATKADQLNLATIPIDLKNHFRFHFYEEKFQTISLARVLDLAIKANNGSVNNNSLIQHLRNQYQGKIIIIGSSAPELNDLKVTPMQNGYPGALLHAVAISNIIENHHLRTPFADRSAALTLLLLTVMFMSFTYFKTNMAKYVTPVLVLLVYSVLSFYFFQIESIDLPLLGPLMFGLFFYFNNLIYLSNLLSSLGKEDLESVIVAHSAK